MSLTSTDLQAIRQIVKEEISPLEGDVKALGNDVKEICGMLRRMDKNIHAIASQTSSSLPYPH